LDYLWKVDFKFKVSFVTTYIIDIETKKLTIVVHLS